MATIRSDNSADELRVDPTSKAARVTLYDTAGNATGSNALPAPEVPKPLPYGTLGHYYTTVQTATMAAGLGANSEIFQFRWTNANLAVIERVTISAINTLAAGFAAGVSQFDLTIARAWSAAGTGGATFTPTGNSQKARTSMGTSLVQEIRVATTAALGAGTKTLDTRSVGLRRLTSQTTANTNMIGPTVLDLFNCYTANAEHPIVLANTGGGEGVVIRASVPATGTWDIFMEMWWAEVTAF